MKTYTFTTEYDPTDENSLYHAFGTLAVHFTEHNASTPDIIAAACALTGELIAAAPPEIHDAIFDGLKERTASALEASNNRKIKLQ